MKMQKKYGFAVISLCCLSLLSLSWLSVYVLEVVAQDSGKRLISRISPSDRWEITYTHSWYRVPQRELYVLGGDGEMVLEEVNFGSYPAALYYDENPAGGHVREDGLWKIKNLHTVVPSLNFKVGYTTDCGLHIKGKRVAFTELAPAGTTLTFTIRKLTILQYLWSVDLTTGGAL
jgi:hypothetical protein